MTDKVVEIKSYDALPMGGGEAPAQVEVTLIDEAFNDVKHQLNPIIGDDRIARALRIAAAWLDTDIFKLEGAIIFKHLSNREGAELASKCLTAVDRWRKSFKQEAELDEALAKGEDPTKFGEVIHK